MAFTYVGTLTTDLDRVRFHLGDTAYEAGPRPADANFTDAELNGLVTLEGNWQRAVAAGFERLAAEWTRYPNFSTDGLRVDRSDIAAGFKAQAAQWRKDYPRPVGISVAGQITRDAYSDDVTSDAVDTSGDYAGHEFEYARPA
jgi:hypothetical protein